jgi:integrase
VQSLTYNDIADLSRWLVREGGKRGQGLGWHAAKASLTTFKQMLDYAVRVEQIVSANVAKGVAVPRSQEPDAALERWTAAEMMTFIETADNDPQAAAWRLMCLGLRREEVLGLTWEAIDFEAGSVAIRQTRVKVSAITDAKGWMLGNPKSRASRRVVRPDDVLPGTMAALKRLRLASPPTEHGLIFIDLVGGAGAALGQVLAKAAAGS